MADHQPTNGNGGNGWLSKVPTFILGGFIAGLIAWGATQAEVQQHDKRINRLEEGQQRSIQQDTQVSERLTRIETTVQFIAEEIRRQQQARR